MEILRRTQGIDFKAKNSSLMGSVELMLKDADSGKVKEVIKQKNMFTNALDSLFNKSAFNMANELNIRPLGNYNQYQALPIQTPIVNKALGGILLFPTALGSDANVLYPDFATNYPTGYASRAEYTQDDSRQGAFNGQSSGHVPDTNSYKFVYDWGSAFGNGVIASVALSNVNCHKYFGSFATMVGSYPYSKTLGSGSWNRRSIGINSKGLWLNSGELSSGSIYLCRMPERKIELEYDPMATVGTYEEAIPDFTYSGADTLFAVNDDYVHVFKITSASASSSNLTFTKIDTSDFTITTTTISNISAYLTGASGRENQACCAVIGNYAYLPKNGWGSVYKINLTNISDVTEIELPSSRHLNYGLTNCGGILFGYDFVIGSDDVARSTSDHNSGYYPCYRDGVWIGKIYQGNTNVHRLFADVLTPYCATHADLETAVTKTADKSMTVNYTVTQV